MAGGKWSVLAASIGIQFCCGLGYAFGIYGDALKHSLGLSQEQLEGLASALALGSYLALPAGLAYDSLQRRHGLGPRSAARPSALEAGCVPSC